MKTCPACQQNVGLNMRVCPHCGHRFIPAIVWVSIMVFVLVVIASVLVFQAGK